MVVLKTNEIKVNPNNPRIIKDFNFKRLVQSVTDFPEMLNLRPIVVNKDMDAWKKENIQINLF
jgi:hypothetical protein